MAFSSLLAVAGICRAQEDIGDEVSSGADAPSGSFLDDFAQQYAQWNPTKTAWLVSALLIAYGVATFAFLSLMNRRSPLVAARFALFWGGITFILVHIVSLAFLIQFSLDLWLIYLIGAVFAVIALLILIFSRRKR